MPANTFGYFLTSRSTQAGPSFGGFLPLCLGGASTIGRYSNNVLQSGQRRYMQQLVDVSTIPSAAGPVTGTAGQTHYSQLWYRRGNGSDFSKAVGVTFH